MKGLRAALGCLTIVPVGGQGTAAQEFGAALLWFPLVGLGIGVVLVGCAWVASLWWQPLVVSALVLVAWIVVTGALHLDGLGDYCDAWYGGQTPTERLHIMKDPHVGAIGVVAIMAVLLLKFGALSSLLLTQHYRALVLAPCLARYAMVVVGTSLPYARAEGGTAMPFLRAKPL